MQLAYTLNLTIHALAGLAAFVALPVPLIARKGGAVHRRPSKQTRLARIL